MPRVRIGGWRWCFPAAAVLAVAAARPGGAVAADAAPGRAESGREIRKVSLEGPDAPKPTSARGPESAPALPGRPGKVIGPTTLDAAAVDGLVAKSLAEAKVAPAPPCGDEEFIRRVFLDVAGILPTPEDVLAFRRDHARDKRARLIDRLVSSPEAARNLARYWRDVIKFHATNENANQVRYQLLEDWLAERFGRNAPWDEVATALITATGRVDENGATALIAAHQGQPVELAGEVSRIFLGVQIQCAQCHDHPNDPWKREQFHQFAAFFQGRRIQQVRMPAPEDAKGKDAKGKDAKGKDAKGKEKAKATPAKKAPPVFQVVMNKGFPRYTMPDKADPQKQVPVEPKFFLAASSDPVPPRLTAEERHRLIASYITGQDDPWFARAFVNRAWGALMGEGFYNPIDDLGPTRTASAPAVLDALADQFRTGGYDVRWLYRTILNTKTYQREFRTAATSAGKTPFAANVPSRLRADQILDTLAWVLDVPLARRGPQSAGKDLDPAKGKGPAFLRNNPRARFNELFGVDPSTPADDVLGTIPQALFLMNGPQVNKAIEARPGTMLGQILLAHPDNQSAIEALYLRVLARRPTPQEIRVCDRHLLALQGDRKACFEDILWCLVNSTEFLSRR